MFLNSIPDNWKLGFRYCQVETDHTSTVHNNPHNMIQRSNTFLCEGQSDNG